MPRHRTILIVAAICLIAGILLIAGRVTDQIPSSKSLANGAVFLIWLSAVLGVTGMVLRHRKTRPAPPDGNS